MPSTRRFLSLPALAGVLLAGACGHARADGVSDLRAALARLGGQAPLKARLEARGWRRAGEGGETHERQAAATLGLEDGPRGLDPTYGRELLGRLDAEARAAVKDKKAGKPLDELMGQLGLPELQSLASAAPGLVREVDESAFKGESADSLGGKPVRRLVFERSIDSLPDDARKYAREFKSVLTLWTTADGTPVASSRRLDLSGRAFLVVTFEQHDEDERGYLVVGDRLVTVRHDEKGRAKGAGENQEYRLERSLQVLP